MSNVEVNPDEIACGQESAAPEAVEIIEPREVPLGGPRAMLVRRTLPARGRSMIGAWCFLDHYGPTDTTMVVPPHPHTGLQTVTWLFQGEVEHRDSLGTHEVVSPGGLNLMTAGHGISHSEVSTERSTTLHGVQLWVALPEGEREREPMFERWTPEPLTVEGAQITVFVGSLQLRDSDTQPEASPVRMFTPIVGAQIALEAGASVVIEPESGFEYGVLADQGTVMVDEVEVSEASLGYLAPRTEPIRISAGDSATRVVLLGGTPFGERIVMWWNFIGRTHEDVVSQREQWQAEIGGADPQRYGSVAFDGSALPAPELPHVRLRPRG